MCQITGGMKNMKGLSIPLCLIISIKLALLADSSGSEPVVKVLG